MTEKKIIKKKDVAGVKKRSSNLKQEDKTDENFVEEDIKQDASAINNDKEGLPAFVMKNEKKFTGKLPKVFHRGTGRRKTAIASVYIYAGRGDIFVNARPCNEYFCNRPVLITTIFKPLEEVKMKTNFDINARLSGGGLSAQADALRHGIARALISFNPELRKILRPLDLLKRDPRMKERKKYGLKKARKAFQYTKR